MGPEIVSDENLLLQAGVETGVAVDDRERRTSAIGRPRGRGRIEWVHAVSIAVQRAPW